MLPTRTCGKFTALGLLALSSAVAAFGPPPVKAAKFQVKLKTVTAPTPRFGVSLRR